MEVETKEKLPGKRERSSESSEDDKPEWEEVTIEEFEKKHGVRLFNFLIISLIYRNMKKPLWILK
jgi:hypothetical protein